MKNFTYFTLLCLFACMGLGSTMSAQPHVQAIEDATGVDFVQHSIVEIEQGEYVIAGTVTPGPISGSSDILVLYVKGTGNIIWRKYVDYGQDEFVGSLMVDEEYNIVLTGYTGTNNTANKRLIIVKLDVNGNHKADIVIGDPVMKYGLYGFDIEQTNNADYIVIGTGVEDAFADASKYAFVLKLDNTLSSVIWSRI